MGIAFSLYDDFSQTANEIERSQNRLGMNTDNLINKINTSMNMMATGAGMVAAGIGLLAPIGYGIKIAGEFEQARIGLYTFLKDYKLVDEVMDTIKTDAALTPFATQDILAANRALISAGLSAKNAREDSLALANAISAVGAGAPELARMALNMQGIKGTGAATSMDLKQFGILGINMYKLVADATGKTEQETRKLKLTYEDISKALRHSAAEGGMFFGAMENQSKSINGKISTLMDYINFAFADLGNAVLPIFHTIIDYATEAVKWVSEFVKSGFGQWVVRIIAVTGVLLVVFGGLLLVTGFLRFGLYKLAGAFGDVTKAEILSTIASKGAVAGFRQMAAAAWASLGPYVLIAVVIAAVIFAFYKLGQMLGSNETKMRQWAFAILFIMGPIGWLIGGIMAIRQGMKDFDDLMNGTGKVWTGLAGVFQKIGGIIRGVFQIFSSYNQKDNTFTLPVKMEEALKKAGILQLVVNIGTYIARLMEFWKGFKEGVKEAYKFVTDAILGIVNAFTPAEEKFKSWDDFLSKSTSDMSKWKEAGRIAGYVIVGALVGIVAMFTLIGVVSLIVLAILVLVIGIIVGWFYLWYKAIELVVTIFQTLWTLIEIGFDYIYDKVVGFVAYMFSLPAKMYDWGVSFVQNMLLGVMSALPKFIGFITSSLSGVFGNAFGMNGELDTTGRYFSPNMTPATAGAQGNNAPTMDAYNNNKAAAAQTTYNTFNPFGSSPKSDKPEGKSAGAGAPIYNNIYLDGELISTSLMDSIERKNSRK